MNYWIILPLLLTGYFVYKLYKVEDRGYIKLGFVEQFFWFIAILVVWLIYGGIFWW